MARRTSSRSLRHVEFSKNAEEPSARQGGDHTIKKSSSQSQTDSGCAESGASSCHSTKFSAAARSGTSSVKELSTNNTMKLSCAPDKIEELKRFALTQARRKQLLETRILEQLRYVSEVETG